MTCCRLPGRKTLKQFGFKSTKPTIMRSNSINALVLSNAEQTYFAQVNILTES